MAARKPLMSVTNASTEADNQTLAIGPELRNLFCQCFHGCKPLVSLAAGEEENVQLPLIELTGYGSAMHLPHVFRG